MSDYADTGFICSLCSRMRTRMRHADMQLQRRPCIFMVESGGVSQCAAPAGFRGEISAAQKEQSMNLLLADLNAGVFTHVQASQSEVLLESERLSAGYSEKLGTQSLDILHVAIAIVLGAEHLLSFDKRQIALARAVGLPVARLDPVPPG